MARLYAIGLALLLAGCVATSSATPASGATEPTTADSSDYKILGRADAPLTIIEFTDLQCPYCANFALQTFPALRERYIDKGLVRFASRDLPLTMHAHAIPAAVAARCAGEQGRYWEYREALFRGQSRRADAP
jgi:protein-disulfide isomerase